MGKELVGYPTYCKLPVTDCTKEYDKCAARRHSLSLRLKQEGGVAQGSVCKMCLQLECISWK